MISFALPRFGLVSRLTREHYTPETFCLLMFRKWLGISRIPEQLLDPQDRRLKLETNRILSIDTFVSLAIPSLQLRLTTSLFSNLDSKLKTNILYFSILLHSFNTKYLFFCPSM
jgi:hypothetical protein